MTGTVRIAPESVHELAYSALTAHGCSDAQANAVARTLTAAESDGAASHGLYRIPFYLRALRESGVCGDAEPHVDGRAPAVVAVDGGRGFAPLALERGAPPLAERARSRGIAALAVTNMFHLAALWPEVERLAGEGLVAFAFTGAQSYLAPAGGRRPLYGTNPMAFAWPRADAPPVVFDQASSASARVEIEVRGNEGREIPRGWALGPDGESTTDPGAALAGAQLPFGGYKGASIALMVELLAGALIGDLFSYEATAHDTERVGAPLGGEFLIAVDPGHCIADGDRAAPLRHAERLFDRILDEPGTRLPADRRYEQRARSQTEGVWVPRDIYDNVRALGQSS